MTKNFKNHGITLIALVITVVILIILASVSINLLIGEDGIIQRAMLAKKMNELAEERDTLELSKLLVALNNDNRGKIPINEYIEELINQNILSFEKVVDIDDTTKQITTSLGTTYVIKLDSNGNMISMNESSPQDSLTVIIQDLTLTSGITSITVNLKVAQAEGTTYKYYYREELGNYVEVYSGTNTNYSITQLKHGTPYWIKVEAINNYGTVFSETLGKTKSVVSGNESIVDIQN